jgi:type II secretory pathway component GspD/PulD (secretin)
MVESLKMMFESKGLTVVVGPSSTAPTLSERDSSSSTGVTAGVLATETKPGGKTLLFRGPSLVVNDAIEAAKSLDIQRAQVLIEVSILDVSDGALKELGVSWSIGGTSFTETDPKGVNFGSITRTPFNFGAAIKALETSDKAKILASPSVRVLDEERAFILIGNRLTLPKFDGYDANRIPIYSTSEYRVGIYLQVAPSISADGTITMAIYPQVSTIVKFTEINGGSYPDIATREAQTTLRVKSGESIVLGGLLKNDEIEQMERVPLLSKIPILGELFTRRKKTKGSSQVVISLTPTLIKGD